MDELIAALISGGVAVVGALCTFIATRLKFKSIKGYYVECPKCGAKIYIDGENLKKDGEA